MMRLFIALPLPQTVSDKLGSLIDLCRPKGGHIKWVAPENIHLTARFLGDTPEDRLSGIIECISEVAARFAPIETELDLLGGFPNLKRPRVIWVGLSRNREVLASLAKLVEEHMRRLRFEKERKPFKAHLTLGRVRQPHNLEELTEFLENYRMHPINLRLDKLCLFKSTLTPSGPIYEVLHQAAFAEDRSDG